jgi:hypothetical protein
MSTQNTNNALWIVNSLVAIAIIVFAFNYFIFPEAIVREDPVPEKPKGTSDRRGNQRSTEMNHYRHIWILGSTVGWEEKIVAEPTGPTGPAKFIPPALSTMVELVATTPVLDAPDSPYGTAFVRILRPPEQKLVTPGDTLTLTDPSNGKTHEATVTRVYELEVYFSYYPEHYNKDVRIILKRDDIGSIPDKGGGDDPPIEDPGANTQDPSGQLPGGQEPDNDPRVSVAIVGKFGSTRAQDDENAWDIQVDEANWALNNEDKLLSEVSLRPKAGGGLEVEKIERGSMIEQRGIKGGDVIISVNGIPVNGPGDIAKLKANPAIKDSDTLRVKMLRQGKEITKIYRLKR